jgi:acyl-CoA synthetase (NDP forming)
MPSYAAAGNPIDVTAQGARSGAYVDAMQLMLASDEVDIVVAVNSLASETRTSPDPTVYAKRPPGTARPIALYSYTLAAEFQRGRMGEAGLLVNANLAAMAVAMKKIVAAAGTRRPEAVSGGPSAAEVTESVAGLAGRSLTEWRTKRLLRGFGIAASHEHLAQSADEALAAAQALGYPVALKIQSESILHKTEVGGVKLGIADAAALRAAFSEVRASAGKADVEGVLVQRMAPPGVEMIVGTIDDPVFGPIVMVGAGGIAVELYRDVAYWPAPLSPAEAERLLRSLRSSARFEGFRGARRMELALLAALVSRLSHVAAAGRGRISELELNPVIVHADGSGLTIADALMRLA